MPSLRKKKNTRFVAERKVRFLGRFYTEALTDTSLAKLRNHVQVQIGSKTKLKLSSNGITTGSKFGNMFGKSATGSVPLENIMDVVVDEVIRDLLLVISKRVDRKIEILAYRVSTETEGLVFQNTHADLMTRYDQRDILDGHVDTNPIYEQNWSMKHNGVNRNGTQIRTPRSGRANGYVPNGMALHDGTYRRIARSQPEVNEGSWSTIDRHRDTVDYNHNQRRHQDAASVASDVSNDSVKKRLDTLSQEVVRLQGIINESKSERGGDDNASDITSTTIRQARLVEPNGGVVKTRVGDYRARSRSQSTGQSGGYNTLASTSSSTGGRGVYIREPFADPVRKSESLRLVYMRDGEDLTDLERKQQQAVHTSRSHQPSTSHHVRSGYPSGDAPAYATVTRQHRPTSTRSARVARSQSVESPSRYHYGEGTASMFNYPTQNRGHDQRDNHVYRANYSQHANHATTRHVYGSPR